MNAEEILRKVEDSDAFKGWGKMKEAYLGSFFAMDNDGGDGGGIDRWQVDFYDPDDDSMTSFVVSGNEVQKLEEESKIFKEKDVKVEELNLRKVRVSFEDAVKVVDGVIDDKYKSEVVTRRIFILQKVKRTMWNVTYLMESFNILNLKIDAGSGEILEEDFKPIMEFRVKR